MREGNDGEGEGTHTLVEKCRETEMGTEMEYEMDGME